MPTEDAVEAPTPGSAELDLIKLLQGMPSWERLGVLREEGAYTEERAAIEACMRQIASYDLDIIRRVLTYYYDSWDLHVETVQQIEIEYPLQDFESKFFLLNQFLFDLPSNVRRDSPHFRFFGGWQGRPMATHSEDPSDSDEIDYRWPWSDDGSGRWKLTGRFSGYMGPMYRGDEAFDFYRKEFGKRRIVATGEDESADHGPALP